MSESEAASLWRVSQHSQILCPKWHPCSPTHKIPHVESCEWESRGAIWDREFESAVKPSIMRPLRSQTYGEIRPSISIKNNKTNDESPAGGTFGRERCYTNWLIRLFSPAKTEPPLCTVSRMRRSICSFSACISAIQALGAAV